MILLMEFVCTRCGNAVLTDESGEDNTQCTECGQQYDDGPSMAARQMLNVPAALPDRVGYMLGRDPAWIDRQRQCGRLTTVYTFGGIEIQYPLSAVPHLAALEGITVHPLQPGTATWVPKPS